MHMRIQVYVEGSCGDPNHSVGRLAPFYDIDVQGIFGVTSDSHPAPNIHCIRDTRETVSLMR